MAVLFALAFLGLGSGVYWLVGRGHPSTSAAAVESPAAKPGAATNPLQKYIEISGLRFVEDNRKKLMAKFVMTNHSGAEISGLAGNVTIWASTKRAEEDPMGTFAFNANLGPYESKELTAPLTTKLKVYELPDWQNATTDLQITAPTALNSAR
jgi:hypothetical protein